jgi:hypothetical protein
MCGGYYPGLWDLEGNAAEWIDSCDQGDAGPKSDQCYLCGGSFIDSQSFCTEDTSYPRNGTSPAFGFRCCGG